MGINFILICLIIILLIITINNQEQFKIECPPGSVDLQAHNSYASNLKAWCTTSNFDIIDYNIDLKDKNRAERCSNGTYRKDAISAYHSDLKTFC
jgi:hypothetical protein